MAEQNWLERLADAIPGLKGYRDKEARRDTDKRFREYLADRIDRARRKLDDIKATLVNDGQLDGLDEIDRYSQRLIKIGNLVRHATYGYSGFFDQQKIQEPELDRIYQYDLSLVSDVEELENSIGEYPSKPLDQMQKEWAQKVGALESHVEGRKDLFSVTG
jgi:hypothetical protein